MQLAVLLVRCRCVEPMRPAGVQQRKASWKSCKAQASSRPLEVSDMQNRGCGLHATRVLEANAVVATVHEKALISESTVVLTSSIGPAVADAVHSCKSELRLVERQGGFYSLLLWLMWARAKEGTTKDPLVAEYIENLPDDPRSALRWSEEALLRLRGSALASIVSQWKRNAAGDQACLVSRLRAQGQAILADAVAAPSAFLWAAATLFSRGFFFEAGEIALVPAMDMFNFAAQPSLKLQATRKVGQGFVLSTNASRPAGEEILDYGGSSDDKTVLLNHGFQFAQMNTTQIDIIFNASHNSDWRRFCKDQADDELNAWKLEALALNKPGEEFSFRLPGALATPAEKLSSEYWARTVQQGLPQDLLFVLRVQLLERSEVDDVANAFRYEPVSDANERRVAAFLEVEVQDLLKSYPSAELASATGPEDASLPWDVKQATVLVQRERQLLGNILQVLNKMP